MTFLTRTVVKLKSAVQLQIVVGIAKATIAVAVPKQSVVLVREHKRNRDLGIILEQILVLAFHIKLLALVLTQAIEGLIIGRVELHLPGKTVLLRLRNRVARLHAQLALGHSKVPELLTVLGFL